MSVEITEDKREEVEQLLQDLENHGWVVKEYDIAGDMGRLEADLWLEYVGEE